MFSKLLSRYDAFVAKRATSVPITMITKDVFGIMGAILGGSYGFTNAMHNSNGVIWRPSGGAVIGYTTGVACGLFPYHTFGILVTADAVHSYYYPKA
jgi:hypothetical protein